ncbi:MAG TPA: hypothetical protein VK977_10150, partial [Actinomycetota bacterium]|nr:hypothetical protein [Actinomycetota bacterium]
MALFLTGVAVSLLWDEAGLPLRIVLGVIGGVFLLAALCRRPLFTAQFGRITGEGRTPCEGLFDTQMGGTRF